MDKTSDLYMEHLTEKAMQYNAKPNVVAEVQVNFAKYALRQKGKVAELAREWGTPTMIDILTENEILAMMEEFRENPQNFRFVA